MTAVMPPAPRMALVIGAAGGIGAAVADTLADSGYRVVAAFHDARPSPTVGHSVHLDIADPASIDAAWDQLTADGYLPDIVVNTAADLADAPILRVRDDVVAQAWATNVTGPIHLLRRCAESMAARRWGRIVLFGTGAAASGNPGQPGYTTAKAGLRGLTRTLARELGPRNITANLIEPGLIDTSLVRGYGEKWWADTLSRVPADRAGTTTEAANVVKFLVSEEAGQLTGLTLRVDGACSAYWLP